MPAKLTPRFASIARRLAPCALIMLTVTGPLQAQSGASPAPAAEQELLLLVDVNDQKLDETVLALQLPDGGIAAQSESLAHWRLRRPQVAPLIFRGATYYPLDSMRGVRYSFDPAR